MGRFVLLKQGDDDYLKKLDLIDTHRQLFNRNPKYPKLSVGEREQLRVLAIGDQLPYMSRRPQNCSLSELQDLKEKVLPGF